jgi:hypothetical protein
LAHWIARRLINCASIIVATKAPILEGLSEVAALGRACVSRLHGIGPKSLASIDHVLGLFGIA